MASKSIQTGRWPRRLCYAVLTLLLFLVCAAAWYLGHFWTRVASIPVVEAPFDVQGFVDTPAEQSQDVIDWGEALRLMASLREADEMVFDGTSEHVADAERFLEHDQHRAQQIGEALARCQGHR